MKIFLSNVFLHVSIFNLFIHISCRGSLAKAKPRKLAEAAQDDSAPGGGAAANRMSMTAASKSRLLTNPRPGPPPPPVVSGIHMVLRLDAPDEVCMQRRADLLSEYCQRIVMYIPSEEKKKIPQAK